MNLSRSLTEPLSQVFDYEIENGYLVYTNEANDRRATREYIRIRYSVGPDGRGIGPLGSASAMAAVIKNIERVAAQEMSGYVSNFMTLPSVKSGQTDQIKEDLKRQRVGLSSQKQSSAATQCAGRYRAP